MYIFLLALTLLYSTPFSRTQVACCTGSKVQILTPEGLSESDPELRQCLAVFFPAFAAKEAGNALALAHLAFPG
jgi:hypothetical protein